MARATNLQQTAKGVNLGGAFVCFGLACMCVGSPFGRPASLCLDALGLGWEGALAVRVGFLVVTISCFAAQVARTRRMGRARSTARIAASSFLGGACTMASMAIAVF